jgi:hypothetical protein
MKKNLELLYELIELRNTNHELFMVKLYDVLTDEKNEMNQSDLFSQNETKLVLESMLKYFESKEEYEKCDVLFHLINHNKS